MLRTTSCLVLLLLIGFFSPVHSQTRALTLGQVVALARQQSPAYKAATTKLKRSYWQYRTYRSDYLPQLRLEGTIPDLNRSIDPITQPDGTEVFRRRSLINSSAALFLSQNVGITGGSVFLSSELSRIDILEPNEFTTYQATPALIGFRQPLFQFNQLAWNRRIAPLQYEESQKQFNEDMETIAIETSDLYFNLLLAQISLTIAQSNQANTDTLFKIAQGRYDLGKIAENELLQLELSLLNAGQDVNRAQLDVENSSLQLRTYLGFPNNTEVELIAPDSIPQFSVDAEKARQEARNNRGTVIGFKRQLLEAERDVAQTRQQTGLNVDVSASFGLTQSAIRVPDLYVNPQDQQRVNIQFNIPLLDWNRSRAIRQTAIAERELVQTNISQSELNFDQQVTLQASQFNLLRDQLTVAVKSDVIAQKRYDITKNRYVIGKIGITDLNIALQEKDQAKRDYVSALRNFWNGYYTLRQLTLYDFENDQPIRYEAEN